MKNDTEPMNSLPVEKLFKRLAETYGASWDRSLGQAPIGDIMSRWADQLSGYFQTRDTMKAVAWALENLPERCPNVIEFRNICRAAPAQVLPALDQPKASPERIKAELDKLAPLRVSAGQISTSDPKAWAHRIIARHEAGDRILGYSLRCAQDALGMNRQVPNQPVHSAY